MSFLRRSVLCGAVVLIGALVAGCADQGPAVAYVNGSEIHQDDYLAVLERTPSGQGQQAGVATLDHLIESRLVVEEARREGVAPSQEELHAALDELRNENPAFREQTRQMGLSDEQIIRLFIEPQFAELQLLAHMAGVNDADVQRYFQQHRADFRIPERVDARVLQVSDRPKADEAAKLLTSTSFESVARMFQPGVANAGAVVTLTRQTFGSPYPPAVVDAAFSTPKGGTSGVLEGTPPPNFLQPQQPPAAKQFYILHVEDHLPAQEPNLNSPLVKTQVLQAVAREKGGAMLSPTAVADLVAHLRQTAQINVVRASVKEAEKAPPAPAPAPSPAGPPSAP